MTHPGEKQQAYLEHLEDFILNDAKAVSLMDSVEHCKKKLEKFAPGSNQYKMTQHLLDMYDLRLDQRISELRAEHAKHSSFEPGSKRGGVRRHLTHESLVRHKRFM